MTKLVIDGYNFLWNERMFRDQAIRGFDKGRDRLLEWLASQPSLQSYEVIVVFDAYKTDASHPSEESIRGLRVVYTAHGQKADDLIREMATMHGPAAVVISSDNEVMRFAEKKGCGVLGSREFQQVLEHPEDFDFDPSHKMPKGKRKALSRLLRGKTTE